MEIKKADSFLKPFHWSLKLPLLGTFLVVQWLRLHASTAGGMGSIPGWGTKMLHALQCGKKKKKNCHYFVIFYQ